MRLVVFLFSSLLCVAAAGADVAGDDREALLHFKSSVYDPAGLLSSWTGLNHCATWTGVTCDARTSRVVSLNVTAAAGSKLAGNLTPFLASLSELAVLSLRFHALSGEIPGAIWGLRNLRVLDVKGNSLTGLIPASIASCTNLKVLDLSNNRINGSIPPKIFDLPNLENLILSANQLSGSIPTSGDFKCSNLQQLDLSCNLLTGALPGELGNCRKLQSLVIFSNLFDDVIPAELGQISGLRVLDVSRNSLSGYVPPEIGKCEELSIIVLSNPFDPIQVQKDLSYGDYDDFNYFQGGIPEEITSLPNLRVLWAPRATLEGELPSNWGKCGNLEVVNLGQNLFSGEFPKVLGQCRNLKYLNLSSNKLRGWISEDFNVPCMDVFDVSSNQLSGEIPRFFSTSCSNSQRQLDDVSSAYSSFFSRRTQAGISLPFIGSEAGFVVYHNFGNNNFTGFMPSLPITTERLGNQSTYALLLDRNKIAGQLDITFLEKCRWLNSFVLSISYNLISGPIPTGIGEICTGLMIFSAPGNRISGMIPESFGRLNNLIALDLKHNWLQGPIPETFGMMKGLNYLLLANNNLSGLIPSTLSRLVSIRVLDLSSNSLAGEIPSGLANLKNLNTLLLDNNKLYGKIPSGFANVTALSMFNLSFNNLSEPLPYNTSMLKCGSLIGNPLIRSCLHVNSFSFPPSSIQGRRGNEGSYTFPPPASSPAKSSSSGFNPIEIASITSAAAIVSVLLALIVLYIYTRKCLPRSSDQSSGRREVKIFHDIGVPVTYESVVRATGNFNASNCIGSGGFGATYKAEIAPRVLVAIKRLSVGRFQGVQQFHAEIKTLGRWRHPNLVTLIGYHVSESEMFLIYNFLPGGNLERFIQERSRRPVDWRMLHKIALDVARALAYLHDHCVPRILHRDVKPSNILLDNDFNAYLSDFGLARLLGNSETHATTGVAGTFGYVAPEYAMTCRVSDKADVYSYGVVLLELISDKKALDPSFSPYGNGFNIVAWACMLLRQGRAREFFTEGLWDVGPHDDLVETLHLAVMCTVETLSIRPTMKQVVQRLKQLQPPTC